MYCCTSFKSCRAVPKVTMCQATHIVQCKPVSTRPVRTITNFISQQKHLNRNKCRFQRIIPKAYADEKQIKEAREELDQLEQERDEASAVAEVCAKRCKRLAEQIGRLNLTAMEEVKQGKELQARKTLEEKHHLQNKYDRLQAKSETNYALAAKLEEIIGKKQTELIALMSKAGTLEFPSTEEPRIMSYTEKYPARGESFSYSDSKGGFQSDKDLEKRFLELERQTLERMLSVTTTTETDSKEQKEDKKQKDEEEGFPGWWTYGHENLSRGIFGVANIEDREQQAERLLKALVNSRVMGQDPDLGRMMVLVRLCSRRLNIEETNGEEGEKVVICSTEASRSVEQNVRTSIFQTAVRECINQLAADELMEGIEPQKASPSLLMGVACVLGLDWKLAANLAASLVCQWMGQKLLDIGADIRRSPTETLLANDNSSVRQLIRVLDSIAPTLQNEHVRTVREKVSGLLSYSELQAVSQMVSKVTKEERTRSVVRHSLGLN